MSDIVDPTPVHAIYRATVTRGTLIRIVRFQIAADAIVHVQDSSRPRAIRFCYEIRPGEAFCLFDAAGRRLGIFADIAAAVYHAEQVTR